MVVSAKRLPCPNLNRHSTVQGDHDRPGSSTSTLSRAECRSASSMTVPTRVNVTQVSRAGTNTCASSSMKVAEAAATATVMATATDQDQDQDHTLHLHLPRRAAPVHAAKPAAIARSSACVIRRDTFAGQVKTRRRNHLSRKRVSLSAAPQAAAHTCIIM